MLHDAIRLLSVLFTSLAMAGGFAHLYALPNKIDLPAETYLTIQQIYRGWALIGIAVIGAFVATGVLAFLERADRAVFLVTAGACACIALSLVLFFAYTFPANQQTANWSMLPDNWLTLRSRWEYSHAAGAVLYCVALLLLTTSFLMRRAE